jgi:two-component system sensor histidine kinase BaeS
VTQGGVSVGRVVVTYLDHLPLLITSRSLVWGWLVVAGLAGLLAATAVGWWVSRRFVRPIRGLTRSAASFAAGDRTVRSEAGGLPGELGELSRALDSAADAVVEQEAAGRQMVADLSHEIRGPLTTLQVGLEELRDGLAPATPERLAALHDQSLRLGRVVEDLTQLASAQETPPSLVPEPCDLAVIAASAVAAKDALIRVSGHMVCPDLQPAAVTADPARVHQVIGNLLDNVIRYCPAGTHVTVSTGSQGTHALLVIEDDGPGIPDADLAHVQMRLYRGENAAGVAGSGIGLAVAAEIVRSQEGTLEIERPPKGHGTRVTVTLAARATVAPDPPTAEQQVPRISDEPRPCPESGSRRESGDRPSDHPAVR